MTVELILAITFLLGGISGGLVCWDTIRRYKKACGLNPDPLDGKELTRLERFVAKNSV